MYNLKREDLCQRKMGNKNANKQPVPPASLLTRYALNNARKNYERTHIIETAWKENRDR